VNSGSRHSGMIISSALTVQSIDCRTGGIDRLVDRVKLALAKFKIPARLALAPTPGAAWAFALTSGSLPAGLSPLPAESLRFDEKVLARCIRVLQTRGSSEGTSLRHEVSGIGFLKFKSRCLVVASPDFRNELVRFVELITMPSVIVRQREAYRKLL